MEHIKFEAARRQVVGKKVKNLRREGKLPAVIYGYGIESVPITLDLREASKKLATIGSSTLVTIVLEGNEHTCLVRERQRDVIYRTMEHVDFQALSLTETVRAQVALIIENEDEAQAIQAYGAILVTAMDSLEVECLPNALIDNIRVDVSGLAEIGDSILVKDIVPPEGVEILEDPDATLIVATPPSAEPEEEEEEEELEPGVEEPEVIERGKAEEEDEEE
jgi:large subunit ribosomal protein L25